MSALARPGTSQQSIRIISIVFSRPSSFRSGCPNSARTQSTAHAIVEPHVWLLSFSTSRCGSVQAIHSKTAKTIGISWHLVASHGILARNQGWPSKPSTPSTPSSTVRAPSWCRPCSDSPCCLLAPASVPLRKSLGAPHEAFLVCERPSCACCRVGPQACKPDPAHCRLTVEYRYSTPSPVDHPN